MTNPLLSVCIPTIPERAERVFALYRRLMEQMDAASAIQENPVEVLVQCDMPSRFGGPPVGAKRDQLIANAHGEYVVFIDDDDAIADTYLPTLVAACRKGADAVGIRGRYFKNGAYVTWYHHSSQFSTWGIAEDEHFERPLNHTNPIRRSIALQVPHQHCYYKEDIYWSLALIQSGLVHTEAETDGFLHEYHFIPHEYD